MDHPSSQPDTECLIIQSNQWSDKSHRKIALTSIVKTFNLLPAPPGFPIYISSIFLYEECCSMLKNFMALDTEGKWQMLSTLQPLPLTHFQLSLVSSFFSKAPAYALLLQYICLSLTIYDCPSDGHFFTSVSSAFSLFLCHKPYL